MWFKIHEHQASLQDPNNLPVLFNCASNGFGGFECYFNQNKLFYRILPPINYQPPSKFNPSVIHGSHGAQLSFLEINLISLFHSRRVKRSPDQ